MSLTHLDCLCNYNFVESDTSGFWRRRPEHTALISGATLTVRRGELSTSFGHLQVPLRVVNGVYFGGESEDCVIFVFILEDSMHRLVMDCGSRAIARSLRNLHSHVLLQMSRRRQKTWLLMSA